MNKYTFYKPDFSRSGNFCRNCSREQSAHEYIGGFFICQAITATAFVEIISTVRKCEAEWKFDITHGFEKESNGPKRNT